MYGFWAYGEQPFGTLSVGQSFSETIVPFYLSRGGYISQANDSIPSQEFLPRAIVPLTFRRSLLAGGEVAGNMVTALGDLQIDNSDGHFDSLLTDFAIDGRRVVVRMGRPTDSYDDFGIVFDGTAAQWVFGETSIQLPLRDNSFRLDGPIQGNLYAGTGGLEGGEDLTEKPKPLCYGKVFNIAATLVDPASLLYQVHDGAINDVPAVYDRGVALTKVGGTPSSGQYSVNTALGTFTLGGSPAGLVTADVEGSASPSYVTATSDIVRRIVEDHADFDDANIDNGSFLNMKSDNAAPVGIYLAPVPRNFLDVLGELVLGVGGYHGFNRNGELMVGVFRAPSGAPKENFTREDVMAITKLPLPAGISPPNWRRRVGYQRNYTVQIQDLAGSVTDARRAYLAEAFRIAGASDGAIRITHLQATDPPVVPGLFANEADASAEATRLLNLYKEERAIYRITVENQFLDLDLGDVVKITFPRWDLTSGKLFRVVGMNEDLQRNRIEVEVFG